MNLTEPRLKEKVEGLLRHIEDDLDIPENTINVLHKYYKVLSMDTILYYIALAVFYEYGAELYFGERYIDFHPLKDKIDHIIEAKKLYDFSLYEDNATLKERFVSIKIASEIYDLLQIFYEEYLKISPPKGDEAYNARYELLPPILKLTDIFLSNNNFLDKTYEILLDIIYLHLEYPGWENQDVYKSIAHLQGLRILNNPEKKDEYMSSYKEYFDKIFSLQSHMDYLTTMDFFKFHEKHIMKNYPEMLSKVSKYISDMEIALLFDDESEDTN